MELKLSEVYMVRNFVSVYIYEQDKPKPIANQGNKKTKLMLRLK